MRIVLIDPTTASVVVNRPFEERFADAVAVQHKGRLYSFHRIRNGSAVFHPCGPVEEL